MTASVDFTACYVSFAVVCISSIFFTTTFRLFGLWPKKTLSGTRQSDVVSFEIIAFGSCVYLSIAGLLAFFSLLGVDGGPSPGQEEINQLYRHHPFVANHLLSVMFAYQTWNTIICIIMNELRSPSMIIHHVATVITVYFGLVTPFSQKHGVYFTGFSEVSSVALSFVVHFQYFPEHIKIFPTLHFVTSIAFAISYMVIRVILWPIYSISFWKDNWDLLTGIPLDKIPALPVVYGFLLCHGIITLLQIYWAIHIFAAFKKIISGEPADSATAQKTKLV